MSTHRPTPQAPQVPYTPTVGEVVRDTQHNAEGVYTGRQGNWAYLRPRGGGIEWQVKRTHVERLTGETELVRRLKPDARSPSPWASDPDEGAA